MGCIQHPDVQLQLMCMINGLEALKVFYTTYTTDKDVQPNITAKPWWTGMAVTCFAVILGLGGFAL